MIRSQITVDVDGIEVTGEITHQTRRCVAIRLIAPLGPLSESSTVPYFAAPYTSFDGEKGVITARQLLTSAYRRAMVFEKHANRLRRRWRWTHSMLLALDAQDLGTPDRISAERRQIRARFRAGEISDREYQKLLSPLNDRRRAYERRRFAILRQFELSRPWSDDVTVAEVVTFLGEDETGLFPEDGLTLRVLHDETEAVEGGGENDE